MKVTPDHVLALHRQKKVAAAEFERAVIAALGSVSQRELAHALGVSQPYIAQVVKHYRRSAYDHNPYMTLESLAQLIKRELDGEADQSYLVRMVAQAMTDFRALKNDHPDQDLYLSEPTSTGDVRWDAMIAAVAEHEARRAGLPIPEWVYNERFVLSPWWFLSPVPGLRAYSFVNSAPEFAVRNVYIDAASLESV